MQTVIITGGTGLVGRALAAQLLERGYKVIILTRSVPKQPSSSLRLHFAQWDVKRQQIDEQAISLADYIVHLAGANVASRRWTVDRKREILESRTRSSELLYQALRSIPNQVRAVVSASAIGYYGSHPEQLFDEKAPPANDFLGQTCAAWESSVQKIAELGKRVIILRSGIVLSREGGALKSLYQPLRFGLATILGSGEQWMSWIHLNDLARLYANALVNDQLSGVYNAVAPHPSTGKEFILQMAKAARGKSFIPIYIPSLFLRLVLGEMSIEVLKSCKVSCEKIAATGFQFAFPTVESAMEQLFRTPSD